MLATYSSLLGPALDIALKRFSGERSVELELRAVAACLTEQDIECFRYCACVARFLLESTNCLLVLRAIME
jgi:hypothetical protein